MSATAPQRHTKTVTEDVNAAAIFTGALEPDELLTNAVTAPTAVEVTTSDLTIENVAINTQTLVDDDGVTVAIGKAVQFHVKGGVAGRTYTVRVTASSDATPPQKRIVRCRLTVEDDDG